jgi:serine phosphatase RsbU (regulator of sigma subunit)
VVVYAEAAIPRHHRISIPPGFAYADLDLALYLGRTTAPAALLWTTNPRPMTSPAVVERVAFGRSQLTLVVHERSPLAGTLLQILPAIIVATGCALALLGGLSVEYLARRRGEAQQLAEDNLRLYAEQRGIASTLQRALLPASLPDVAGIEFAVRYAAGVGGIDIGGDWYDVVRLDDERCFFVVGDVSGRGLGAATTMASLRFAIRAFAAEGHRPDVVLAKLKDLLLSQSDGALATALCGHIDVPGRRLWVATAGHLPALVVEGGHARYAEPPVGPLLGVAVPSRPRPVDVPVAEGATVIAFTDGLVERRGELLDEGLERLRVAAEVTGGDMPSVIDQLMATMVPGGSSDDIAVLGVRWRS